MNYYSVNRQAAPVDFKEATINGQAPDKGLYFPQRIPVCDASMFKNLKNLSKEEIAFSVISPFVGNSIPKTELQEIVQQTVNFEFPLVQVTPNAASLELFHGPTLAFKDVGARFMSRCLGYFSKELKERIVVLVATSGDTGGAVADGFFNVDGVDVVILYPSGKVSQVQEKQLTAMGGNIHAIEVNGNFDDCQRMVKQAFADNDLRQKVFLTSANSINVARWLPQQFYYFFALQQWNEPVPPVISVPSGNFGNICAGLMAWKAGLPVKHFVAACNSNDTVPEWFKTGRYLPQPARATISNAMDVGDPSNFVRILEIFNNDTLAIKKMISSYSFSDEDTRKAMNLLYNEYNYIADPHGAVAFLGLQEYLKTHPSDKGIFLETAHPVKFNDVVESVIGKELPIPESILEVYNAEKKADAMDVGYNFLKEYLLELK